MTTDKKKIYWNLNWILCAVVFVILAAICAYRYFSGYAPIEANWFEEVMKYLAMWIPLTVIAWTIAYVPFKAYSSYLAKKRGGTED